MILSLSSKGGTYAMRVSLNASHWTKFLVNKLWLQIRKHARGEPTKEQGIRPVEAINLLPTHADGRLGICIYWMFSFPF